MPIPARSPAFASTPDYRVVLGLTAGELSGVDVFATRLIRGLRKRGIAAHALLSRPQKPWNALALPEDVPRHELSLGPDEPWGSRWDAMIRHLEDHAPCVYVPNYDYEHSCVVPRLPPAVRVAGIVHSDDPDHYEHVSRMGRFWDAVVAVSPAVARETLALDPTLAGRLLTIPYGVPLPETVPERPVAGGAPLEVAYAGRLEQVQKRVLDLPPIFERLAAQGVPARLTIVGDGHRREELVRRCGPLIERGVVRLLGTRPNPAVLEIFERSDVAILTSDFEGLPVSLLEAMSRGCVPVVTDLRSGIPDLVEEGVSGFRVPVGSVEGFAERLAALQRDPARLGALSRRAFRAVRERGFDVEGMVERYAELFESLAGRPGRPSGRRRLARIPYPPRLEDVTWKDQLPPPLRAAGTWGMRWIRRLAPPGRARPGAALR